MCDTAPPFFVEFSFVSNVGLEIRFDQNLINVPNWRARCALSRRESSSQEYGMVTSSQLSATVTGPLSSVDSGASTWATRLLRAGPGMACVAASWYGLELTSAKTSVGAMSAAPFMDIILDTSVATGSPNVLTPGCLTVVALEWPGLTDRAPSVVAVVGALDDREVVEFESLLVEDELR